MNDILVIVFFGLTCFTFSYFGAKLALRGAKWRIITEIDENNMKIESTIEPQSKPTKSAEFITEPDQAKLDELNQDPQWKRFLSGFKKSNE